MTVSMAKDLKRDGILVQCFCPGWVQTDLGTARATLSPEESISGVMKVLATSSEKDTGKFKKYNGETLNW